MGEVEQVAEHARERGLDGGCRRQGEQRRLGRRELETIDEVGERGVAALRLELAEAVGERPDADVGTHEGPFGHADPVGRLERPVDLGVGDGEHVLLGVGVRLPAVAGPRHPPPGPQADLAEPAAARRAVRGRSRVPTAPGRVVLDVRVKRSPTPPGSTRCR